MAGQRPAGELLRDYSEVKDCAEPPAGALAEIWCRAHPESQLATCRQTDPQPPSDPDPNMPIVHVDNSDNPADGSGSRTSSACQLSPGPARGAGLGLVMVALGLAGAWRRRRT